jgi:hypothetical protein
MVGGTLRDTKIRLSQFLSKCRILKSGKTKKGETEEEV